MHRYIVGGILDDLRAGKRVVVSAKGEVPTARLFLQVAEQALLEPDAHLFRVYRARGQQRITVEREGSWRGVAHFHTLRTLGDFSHGQNVDVVVLAGNDSDMVRREAQRLAPALYPDGEVVHLDRPLAS